MVKRFMRFVRGWQYDAPTELAIEGFINNFVKSNILSFAAGASIQIAWPHTIESDEVRRAIIDRLERYGFDVTMDDYPQEYQLHIVQVKNINARNQLMQQLRSMRNELKAEIKELVAAYIKLNNYEASMPFPKFLGRYDMTLDTAYTRQIRKVFLDAFNRQNYRMHHFNDEWLMYDNGEGY